MAEVEFPNEAVIFLLAAAFVFEDQVLWDATWETPNNTASYTRRLEIC
jgi:hypothetical protein